MWCQGNVVIVHLFISRLLRYPVTPSIYWVNVRPRETTLNVIDVQKPYQNQNTTPMLLKRLVIVSAATVNPLYTNGFFLLVWCNKLGIVHCKCIVVLFITPVSKATFNNQKKGSAVVESLSQDRGAAVSNLTGVTSLCPWGRHIYPSLVILYWFNPGRSVPL